MHRSTPLVCLFAFASVGASAQATGEWVNVFRLFDHTAYARMSLTQTGDALTGTVGNEKVTGSVRDGMITLSANVPRMGETKATGTFQGGEIRGTAVFGNLKAEWRAYQPKAITGSPRVHAFEPKEFHRSFSGAIPPALHINPGDTVKTWTVDAGGVDSTGKRRSVGGNPETGPFYIEGALPGDSISVRLNRVRLNRDSAISSGGISASALDPYYFRDQERTDSFKADWVLDREHGIARLKEPTEKLKNFTIPLRPMMGCIGVAPPGHMAYRSGYLGAFGGNMDYREIREGVTVYLPVFEEGALLFVGDGHAAQGDGELTGNALETSMDVEFTVDLIKSGGEDQDGPRAENDEYLMSMGIAGSLDQALREATTGLSKWLEKDYGLNPGEVSAVLGTSMKYDIAEVVDPYVHLVAKVSRQSLAPLKKIK